jgi:hypothetical protein
MLLTIVCDLFVSKLLIRLRQSANVALRHVISSFWSWTRFSRSATRSRSISFSFSIMSSLADMLAVVTLTGLVGRARWASWAGPGMWSTEDIPLSSLAASSFMFMSFISSSSSTSLATSCVITSSSSSIPWIRRLALSSSGWREDGWWAAAMMTSCSPSSSMPASSS